MEAHARILVYVSFEGTNTNTPELKQSGHPTSGAADSSGLKDYNDYIIFIW
jgi:hypothetical protein